jgi:hypothetical protein
MLEASAYDFNDHDDTIELEDKSFERMGEDVDAELAWVNSIYALLERTSGSAQEFEFSTDYDCTRSPYRSRQQISEGRPLERIAEVNTMYKTKDKKIRPVDQADSIGSTPGGRLDWYERSKARDIPQKQEGRYQDHIIPRFSDIPRQSRLTPERLAALEVGDTLQPAERAMLDEILINREKAIAFDWTECGKFHEDVSPPIILKTVDHEAWQAPSYPCPRALRPIVIKMLQERLEKGVLEYSEGPYRNPWFLVSKKKPGEYRLINSATKLNAVTRRDANLPPTVDEFAEEFAGCQLASLVDLYSGYDQQVLHPSSRDLTAFFTPLGLLRCTTLPQGCTNSVAQFVRIMNKILEGLVPDVAMTFLDDMAVKGPYVNYDCDETLPGIRRFVFEHLQNLDKTLERIERAGATIGAKSQFCLDGMNIVGFVCNSKGREPSAEKIVKILNWKTPVNVTEAKGFVGLCSYFRIWIKNFATIADPIYSLQRKGVEWHWDPLVHGQAMQTLQDLLTTAPILVKIDYGTDAGEIVVGVDASGDGWGGYLGQRDEKSGKVRPSRYESGVWNTAERTYDATKRECRGVLKILKKLQIWIIGVHFILETDANVLVAQLNRAATDHPSALITRWIAWIRLFDFEVRHVPGKKHALADGLSRRPPHPDDPTTDKEDIDDWILAELGAYEICPVSAESDDEPSSESEVHTDSELVARREILASMKGIVNRLREEGEEEVMSTDEGDTNAPILSTTYSEDSVRIATYLTTLKKPKNMMTAAFKTFKREALKYGVHGRQLWRLPTKGMPIKLVVDDERTKARILQDLHDQTGHKGRESTYYKVSQRYFWHGCYRDVQTYVRSCPQCQHRDSRRAEEPMYPTAANGLMEKWAIDITYMPSIRGRKRYLVVARDDMSGWVEARLMTSKHAKKVAEFIWEDIICRHGLFWKLVLDGGTENMGEVIKLLNKQGVERIQISAYHAQSNGAIERGHRPIKDALSKLDGHDYEVHLSAVLFAERVTVHGPTGLSPFYLVYGREPILPVESRHPTWRTLFTDEVTDRSKLIELRAKQFLVRNENAEEARLKKTRRRQEGKEYFDAHHNIRSRPFQKDDIVLRHDSVREVDMSSNRKLDFRWLGPYQILHANTEKGYYHLKELGPDGPKLRGTFAGSRLKLFHKRQRFFYSPEDELSSLDSQSEVESSATEPLAEPEELFPATEQVRTGDFVIRVPAND